MAEEQLAAVEAGPARQCIQSPDHRLWSAATARCGANRVVACQQHGTTERCVCQKLGITQAFRVVVRHLVPSDDSEMLMFREVPVVEVREEPWLWSMGHSFRGITRLDIRSQEHAPDDFFITDHLGLSPSGVTELVSDCWSIEVKFRGMKQYLHRQDPQFWVRQGPARMAAVAYPLRPLVWHWFMTGRGGLDDITTTLGRPSYAQRHSRSLIDALAALQLKL